MPPFSHSRFITSSSCNIPPSLGLDFAPQKGKKVDFQAFMVDKSNSTQRLSVDGWLDGWRTRQLVRGHGYPQIFASLPQPVGKLM